MNSEEVFGYVYRQLPAIEKEIDLTMTETAVLLDYFRHASGPETIEHSREQALSGEEIPKIFHLLHRIESSFTGTSKELIGEKEMRRSLNLFMGTEGGRDAGVTELLDLIAQVKERLTEIEIVSLNAIIYAAHLGDEGRAFGVISDKINALSNQVSEHYSLLQVDAHNLSEWNNRFMEGFQGIIFSHEELDTKQREGFKDLFSITRKSLDAISSILQNLMGRIKAAVEPVEEIMVSIQSQDIIRQSMENLNKCLTAIDEHVDRFTSERSNGVDTLQLLYFVSRVLDLSIKLADNIEVELSTSLAALESLLADIVARLGEIRDGGSLSTDKDIIPTLFLQAQQFMEDFAAGFSNMQEQIDSFADLNKFFYKHMSGLEKRIEIIKGHVDFLKKLGFLTRIELARLNRGDGSFEQEISAITDRVISDVDSNEGLITSLKKRLHKDLLNFEQMLVENRNKTGVMLRITWEARENLEEIEKKISCAVQSLGESCRNLVGAVEDDRLYLERNQALPAAVRDIKTSLLGLAGEVEKAMEEALRLAGLEKWEGITEEMQELLGGLTTYLERLTASELFTGMAMDVGGETGELTLF